MKTKKSKPVSHLPAGEEAEILEGLVLSGRCTEEDLAGFSPEELHVLAKVTAEYLNKGESLTIKSIEAADYIFEVPNILTLVEDPQYLGHELGFLLDENGKRVSDKKQLFTFWYNHLDLMYNKGKHYNEVLITGAIGTGKTTFMNIIQLYELLNLMALKNPQLHYGLMPSTTIVVAFFNILKNLVMDVGYRQFQDMIESSPFFKKIMAYNSQRKAGTRYAPPAHRKIELAVGSRIAHTLGRAVFCAQIDEANFGQDKEDKSATEKKSQVYENYISLRNRKTSRFPTAPGKFCIGSSKRSTSDFLEKHIDDSRGKIDSSTYIIDAPVYEVKKCRGIYSGKKFKVLLGDLTRSPKILEEKEKVADNLKSFVIEVPEELKQNYEDDIIGALRDHSGIAAMPKSAFFTNRDSIRSLLSDRESPWRYTSKGKTIPNTINVSFFGKDQIADFLDWDKVAYNKGSLPYKNNPRFLSIDTGSAGDAAGIGMTCRAGIKVMHEPDEKGSERALYVPQYHTDFYIRIKGINKEEFPLYKLTEFVKFLVKNKNVNIKAMTTDGFQSVQLRQDVLIAFPSMIVDLLSVDRDDKAHLNLRNIVNAQALSGLYQDDNLLTELFDLMHVTTQARGSYADMLKMIVDHPQIASDGFVGRKDVTDALTASLYTCKELDKSVSMEEIREQVGEMKKINLEKILKEADLAVDQAMKEVDELKLDDINFGEGDGR